MAFLEAKNISYRYPDSPKNALSELSFRIEAGENVAIVGANGSGKSTLARLLNGLHCPDTGSVEVEGFDTKAPGGAVRARSRISLVFQSPQDQIVAATAEQDVAFGPENQGLGADEISRRVKSSLERVGISGLAERQTSELSPGTQQLLAVAGALAMESPCLLLDEAASMVDPHSRAAIMKAMDQFAASGKTLIRVTHSMSEAARAGRVLALAGGRLVFDGSPSKLFARTNLRTWGLELPDEAALLFSLGLDPSFGMGEGASEPGKLAAALAQVLGNAMGERNAIESRPLAAAQPVLTLGKASFSYPSSKDKAVDGACLTLHRGELVALAGRAGSGKSSLLELCNALKLPATGRVQIMGVDTLDRRAKPSALRRRAALLMQNAQDALFEPHAADDAAYGPRCAGLRGRTLVDRVRSAMDSVGLPYADFRDRHPRRLSGGERRKLALAGVMALDPDVYLFDEPTASMDPVSRNETLASLTAMALDGKAVLFATHDMEEAALADRVIVLNGGKIAFDGPPAELFLERNPAAWGLERTLAARLYLSLAAGTRSILGKCVSLWELSAGLLAFIGKPAQRRNPFPMPAPFARAMRGSSPRTTGAAEASIMSSRPMDEKAHARRARNAKSRAPFDLSSRWNMKSGALAGSPLGRIDPVVKYAYLLLWVCAALISRNPWVPMAVALSSCAIALRGSIPLKRLFGGLKGLLPFALAYVALQIAFPGRGAASPALLRLGKFSLSTATAWSAALMLSKLVAAMAAINLFAAATPLDQISHGLEDILRPLAPLGLRSANAGILAGIVFRFAPILVREAEGIMKAQACRGSPGYEGPAGGRIKAALSIMVPVAVRALERGQTLAEAMEARCFSPLPETGKKRGRYGRYARGPAFRARLAITLFIGCALISIAVLAR